MRMDVFKNVVLMAVLKNKNILDKWGFWVGVEKRYDGLANGWWPNQTMHYGKSDRSIGIGPISTEYFEKGWKPWNHI